MTFKIMDISHGWFEVDIDRKRLLCCSNYLGYDGPLVLLETLCELMEHKVGEKWICW